MHVHTEKHNSLYVKHTILVCYDLNYYRCIVTSFWTIKRVAKDKLSQIHHCQPKLYNSCNRQNNNSVHSTHQVVNKMLYSSSSDGTAKCWVIEFGDCTRTYKGFKSSVTQMHFQDGICKWNNNIINFYILDIYKLCMKKVCRSSACFYKVPNT